MFFHILKKDLQRQRSMNVILLVFIIMASMFLASSVSNFLVLSGAVDRFMDMSNVPDFLTLMVSGGGEDELEEFLGDNEEVEDYQIEPMFNLNAGDIEITKRTSGAKDSKKFEISSTEAIGAVPETFMKVFDQEGAPLSLKNGEIAIAREDAEKNNLEAGDKLKVTVGEVEQEFTIKTITRDAVFGSSMMGFKRMLISEEDFAKFEDQQGLYTVRLYSVMTADQDAFMKSYRKMEFSTISNIERSLIKMCYLFDMLISGILIIVSVCLIIIAFLILRFSIVFTMQEDFRQIGIMKAIGIKDKGIRRLYLVKYLAIATVGSAAGLVLSFPFGAMLSSQGTKNLVYEGSAQNVPINIGCAFAVVVIVLLFCCSSTRHLKKITVMKAIRDGSEGERYKAKNILKLGNRKRMRPAVYMAWNDILSSGRRFLTLGLIFLIGTLLIQLPLMALNTLQDKDIVKSFSISPSDAYIDNGRSNLYIVETDDSMLKNDMDQIRTALKDKGYDAKVWTEISYMIPCYSNDPQEKFIYMTMQTTGDQTDGYDILEGELPVLPNEIMVTEKTAEEMGVGIGDELHFKFGDETEDFLITGLYQSMMNMGNGYRFSQTADIDYSYINGIMSNQVEIAELEPEEACQVLREIYPDYEISDYKGYIKDFLGELLDQMDVLKTFIVTVILLINMLITVLIMKSIITKEHGEIALLKSIGFSDRTLRGWQTLRILIVLFAAIVVGTLLTKILAPCTIGPVFAVMGAGHMKLVSNAFEMYLLYPLLLLGITGIASYLCAGEIRRIDVKEVNNLE